MNRIIKMQQEQFPMSSPSYDNAFFNHCLTTFYDQDSEDIIQAKCSAQDVYSYVQHAIDLCDTPINEIMQLVCDNSNFKGVDFQIVRRKILKQKNLLKRNRAKNRKIIAKQRRPVIDLSICEKEEDQYKKQRNRISAQISRDKKKQKIKALQGLNIELQKQCERQKFQNQRLREQIQKNKQKPFKNGQVITSKFSKLLILLGIIFLFGLIKDIFNSQSKQVMPLTKINQVKSQSFQLTNGNTYANSIENDKVRILASIEDSLVEVVEQKGMVARMKQKIMNEMRNWNGDAWGLTMKAREELLVIKQNALM